MFIDRKNLFKLPFSKNNNPNGWIELTTFCQLKCPHCYRKVGKGALEKTHRDLNSLFFEIDELVKIRNINILSIAGGEPLLYPYLDDVIKYAVSKNLMTMIYTNGILLNKERLSLFKKLGVTRIMIHIDKYQGRGGITSEVEANELRVKYCDLFREVGGVSLGFIMPISEDNFQDLDVLISFFKKNADVIKAVAFTPLSIVPPGEKLPVKKIDDIEKFYNKARNLYGLEYCAYLGKTKLDEISWLFSYNVFLGSEILGSVDKEVVEIIQNSYYKKTGGYFYVSNEIKLSWRLISLLLNKSIWKIIKNYTLSPNKSKITGQLFTFTNSPDNTTSGLSLCDGCPNAMLYKGKLIPSCLLEPIKEGCDIEVE